MRKIKEFKRIRTILIIVAVIIAFISLFVSQSLVRDLSREEQNKMELFAKAYQTFNAADENTDLSMVLAVITGNKTIPVIVTDDKDAIISWLNIEIPGKSDTVSYLSSYAERMRQSGNSIRLFFDESDESQYNEVCFDESVLLTRLTVYPYIQMGVVMLFVLIAIFALLSFKKTEQNRVWVGLSKETAHQLGTPISSLMAWTELLKDKYEDDELICEMEKDVHRLEMVAERFSKIGSLPEPVQADMVGVLNNVIEYVEHRSPATVRFIKDFPDPPVNARVNSSLFGWVIENLCKNAVDAMDGKGTLKITLKEEKSVVAIEVSDTGKGIAKNTWKSVFDPGYTTKQRGWGLGLSLARRIVSDYHKGRIFVLHSELGKGTTFRVELPK
ncbi:MAG: HAMP domain-containing histidine kinase [Bacteroidaceae bacterium]|nr:HAMP domain-containing histidine kinase [Candidatus Colenecus caballi]MCQ2071984.1 HAMP domain-containing histidine kinase [Bacteroidaceae bacterium]